MISGIAAGRIVAVAIEFQEAVGFSGRVHDAVHMGEHGADVVGVRMMRGNRDEHLLRA